MGQRRAIVSLALYNKSVVCFHLIFSFSGRLNHFWTAYLFFENSFQDEVIEGNLSI